MMPFTTEVPFPPPAAPHPGTPLEPPSVWVEPRWEYRDVIRRADDEAPLSEAELNALGREHWELAGVVSAGGVVHYYFKRAANP